MTEEANPTQKAFLEYMTNLHDEIEILKLGVDYKEYRLYLDISPGILCPTFEKLVIPFGFDETFPLLVKSNMMYEFWKTKLKDSIELYNSKIAQIVKRVDIRRRWLAFGFRFVEQSILTWQRVKREDLFDLIKQLFDIYAASQSEKQGENDVNISKEQLK